MAGEQKYSRSGRRSIISGVDIISSVGEQAIVCIPRSAVEITRALVRNRGYWRTTYAMAYSDTGYTLPNDAEFDIITEQIDLFLEATNDMSCNDLVSELDDIGNAILALSQSGGCGCGSHGAGSTSPAAGSTNSGDIFEPTGTPPTGYPDWETYQVIKCDAATFIVQSLIDDIRYYQVVSIATLTVGALATGMISVVSGFTLTAILAGLLGILAYSVGMLFLAETQLVAGFDDLVCAILTGETAQESMDNFISEMTTQMIGAIADPISEFLIIQLISAWVDTTFFNILYTNYDDMLTFSIPGGADCSACGLGCTNYQILTGVWLGGLTFDSVLVSTAYRVELFWNTDSTDCTDSCSPMENVKIMSIPGWSDAGAINDNFRIWSDAACPISSTNADAYSSDTPPPLGTNFCQRVISILSGTPFTATFERSGKCF